MHLAYDFDPLRLSHSSCARALSRDLHPSGCVVWTMLERMAGTTAYS